VFYFVYFEMGSCYYCQVKKKKQLRRTQYRVRKTWIERTISRAPFYMGVLAFCTFTIVIYPLVASIYVRDTNLTGDSDLQWRNITLNADENAFSFEEKLRAMVTEPVSPRKSLTAMIEGATEWDDSYVSEIREENVQVCAILQDAAHRKYYQDPKYANILGADLIKAQEVGMTWRKTARVCALESIARARSGDVRGGVLLAGDIVQMGDMIEEAQAPSLGYLLGASVKLFGLSAYRTIARDVVISPQIAQEIEMALQEITAEPSDVTTPLRGEYLVQAAVIDAINEGEYQYLENVGLPQYKKFAVLPYYFQPQRTKENVARVYRQIIQEAEKSCVDYEPIVYRRELALPIFREAYFTPNLVGRTLEKHVIIPSTGFIEKRCADEVNVGLTEVLVGLETYKKSRGVYPQTLDELVPRYLASLPKDPFSGEGFYYDRAQGIVASIGPKAAKRADGTYEHTSEGYMVELQ